MKHDLVKSSEVLQAQLAEPIAIYIYASTCMFLFHGVMGLKAYRHIRKTASKFYSYPTIPSPSHPIPFLHILLDSYCKSHASQHEIPPDPCRTQNCDYCAILCHAALDIMDYSLLVGLDKPYI